MSISTLASLPATAIPADTVLAACGMDWMAGDPEDLPHPVRAMGALIRRGEALLLDTADPPSTQLVKGALLATGVTALFASGAVVLLRGSRHTPALRFMVEAGLAWTTIAAKNLLDEAQRVLDALDANDLPLARQRVGRIVGRDTADLDETEVARAVIETLAESCCDGIVAPLFWLCAAGVPSALGFKALSTMDSMIGHREAPYTYFGRAAARADDVANFIPARATALLLAAAAAYAREDPMGALITWRRDGHLHSSPNAGHCEAALAGALDVELGGINSYDGVLKHAPRLNEGAPGPTRDDVRRAIGLVRTAALFAMAGAILFCAWRNRAHR